MDGVSVPISNSVNDVNQILQMATEKGLDMEKKMLRANVEMAVKGSESGKGMGLDVAG